MIRRGFLKGILAAIGAAVVPTTAVGDPRTDFFSAMRGTASRHQRQAAILHVLFLWRWKFHQEWTAYIRHSKYAPEYGFKDFSGVDVWLNSLNPTELKELYHAVRDEFGDELPQWALVLRP